MERILVSVVLGLAGRSVDLSSVSSSPWWLEESPTDLGCCDSGVVVSACLELDSSMSTSLSLVVDSFRSTDISWSRMLSKLKLNLCFFDYSLRFCMFCWLFNLK